MSRQSVFKIFAKPPAYRPLSSGRSPDCAAIHGESFAYPWDEADFDHLLAADEVVADGAFEADESLCGMILSRVGADEAEILTIAVLPERRRAGVGANLIAAHLPRLAARGVARLFLEVETENHPARALYATHGFLEVGERRAYYRKKDASPARALLLRRDIGLSDLGAAEFAG